MKRAVVIGGAGFIGSNLCKRLAYDGVNVTSLDNYGTGSELNHVPGVGYKKGCASKVSKYSMPLNPDVVFHLGEFSRVEQSVNEPFNSARGIRDTLLPVIEYCHRVNAKLIYSGSSTRFGDAESPYSIAKACNAQFVKDFCSYMSIDYAITYFYNVYGPGEIADGDYATVIAKFLRKKKEGESVTVTYPGSQRRNFTHVHDIIDGLVMAADKGFGDSYGIGSDESYSVIDVCEMMEVRYTIGSGSPANRTNSYLENSKTKELGWEPKRNLRGYIREALSA